MRFRQGAHFPDIGTALLTGQFERINAVDPIDPVDPAPYYSIRWSGRNFERINQAPSSVAGVPFIV